MYALLEQKPLQIEHEQFPYDSHYASHFFKAMVAVHNTIQARGEEKFQRETAERTGTLFSRFVNLTGAIQHSLQTKQVNEELKYMLENVNLLAHCHVEIQGQPVTLQADPRGTELFKSLFDSFYFDGGKPDYEDRPETHVFSTTKLMQALQSSKTKIANQLRCKAVSQGAQTMNMELLNDQQIWFFLVRNERACYQVIIALKEQETQNVDPLLLQARQEEMRYPAAFIGQNIFGSVPAIDGTFRVVDVVSLEYVNRLLKTIHPSASQGLLFFKYALHWACSNMQSDNAVENVIKRVMSNQLGQRIGQLCAVVYQDQSGIQDQISQQLFQHTFLFDLSPGELVLFNSILSPGDQMHLAEVIAKHRFYNPNKFYDLVANIFAVVQRELLNYCGERAVGFKVSQELEVFKLSLHTMLFNLCQYLNPLELSEPQLVQLAYTLVYSSQNIAVQQAYGIVTDTAMNQMLKYINTSKLPVFGTKNQTPETQVAKSIMKTIAEIRLTLQARNEMIFHLDKVASTHAATLHSIEKLISPIMFSAHIFGELNPSSGDSHLLKTLHGTQQKDQDADYHMHRALKESGVLPSDEIIAKLGDGRPKVLCSILLFNFAKDLQAAQDFRQIDSSVVGRLIQTKQLTTDEFDDFLQEQILQPNSRLEYWYDVTKDTRKVRVLTGDEVRLAMSDMEETDIRNDDVLAIRQQIKHLKQTYVGESDCFIVDDHPITIQIIANVSGVKRLLFQSTIVLAATHQTQNQKMLTETRQLDKVIRDSFEAVIAEIVQRLNSEKGTFNGFLTLCSSLEIVYRNEMGSDLYREFDLTRQNKLMRSSKVVCRMHFADQWRRRVQRLLSTEHSNVSVMYLGLTCTGDLLMDSQREVPQNDVTCGTDQTNPASFGRINFTHGAPMKISLQAFLQATKDLVSPQINEVGTQILRAKYKIMQRFEKNPKQFKIFSWNPQTGEYNNNPAANDSPNNIYLIIFYDEQLETKYSQNLLPLKYTQSSVMVPGTSLLRDIQRGFHQGAQMPYCKTFRKREQGTKVTMEQVLDFGYIVPVSTKLTFEVFNERRNYPVHQLAAELFLRPQQPFKSAPSLLEAAHFKPAPGAPAIQYNLTDIHMHGPRARQIVAPLLKQPAKSDQYFFLNYQNAFPTAYQAASNYLEVEPMLESVQIAQEFCFEKVSVPSVPGYIAAVKNTHREESESVNQAASEHGVLTERTRISVKQERGPNWARLGELGRFPKRFWPQKTASAEFSHQAARTLLQQMGDARDYGAGILVTAEKTTDFPAIAILKTVDSPEKEIQRILAKPEKRSTESLLAACDLVPRLSIPEETVLAAWNKANPIPVSRSQKLHTISASGSARIQTAPTE